MPPTATHAEFTGMKDLLGHPKLAAFVSQVLPMGAGHAATWLAPGAAQTSVGVQGGSSSLFEALWHGAPLVLIPL